MEPRDGRHAPFSGDGLRVVDALAQRWHIAPSAVLEEPAWLVRGIAMLGDADAPELTEDDLMRGMLAARSEPLDG